jgi:hypothetical protein
MEIKTEQRVFKVEKCCDLTMKCDGLLRRDMRCDAKLTNPPQFPHTCTKCKKQTYLFGEYPKMEFEDKK